jgi:hypothetical protein
VREIGRRLQILIVLVCCDDLGGLVVRPRARGRGLIRTATSSDLLGRLGVECLDVLVDHGLADLPEVLQEAELEEHLQHDEEGSHEDRLEEVIKQGWGSLLVDAMAVELKNPSDDVDRNGRVHSVRVSAREGSGAVVGCNNELRSDDASHRQTEVNGCDEEVEHYVHDGAGNSVSERQRDADDSAQLRHRRSKRSEHGRKPKGCGRQEYQGRNEDEGYTAESVARRRRESSCGQVTGKASLKRRAGSLSVVASRKCCADSTHHTMWIH